MKEDYGIHFISHAMVAVTNNTIFQSINLLLISWWDYKLGILKAIFENSSYNIALYINSVRRKLSCF